jgi:hypothetical protein
MGEESETEDDDGREVRRGWEADLEQSPEAQFNMEKVLGANNLLCRYKGHSRRDS